MAVSAVMDVVLTVASRLVNRWNPQAEMKLDINAQVKSTRISSQTFAKVQVIGLVNNVCKHA